MKWIKANLLIVLFALGIILLSGSVALYKADPSVPWITELAEAIMGLSFTVIFGGIIKLIFDKFQEDKRKEEKEREFRMGILNQLRKVFDNVDGARLLIVAHKSAKTYSGKMQENIIPSIVTLYDIKRSLFDSGKMMEEKKLLQLRLNIHYMIAYLRSLAIEYENSYQQISNKQFLHEKLKEKAGLDFVKKLCNAHPDDYYSDEVLRSGLIAQLIKHPPKWIWHSILGLPQMGLFIKEDFESPYRKMFVDFYEDSKSILRDAVQENDREQASEDFFNKALQEVDAAQHPAWYKKDHLKEMLAIDELRRRGALKQGDSLVTTLVEYLSNNSKNQV